MNVSSCIAVILAGGSGTRLGSNIPKQFLEINGRKVIEYTIDAFELNDLIDEIAIVVREDFIDDVRAIVAKNRYSKVKKLLKGGAERYHSSLAAIAAYPEDDVKLLFHDAVRPMVSQRIINDCVTALELYDAVDVGIKTSDTIIQVDDGNCIRAVPQRSRLRNGQTPQGFRRGVICKAYELALKDPSFTTTDDCGTVLRYLPEVPIYVVEGESSNMKVTYKEDVELLKHFLKG